MAPRPGLVLSAAIGLALAAAPAAGAQPAGDPIAALLDQPSAVPEEPDTASQPPMASEPDPVIIAPSTTPGLPRAPIPYAPQPRPELAAPVHVDEIGKTPDAPPTLRDMAYESRIKSSFASAQNFQGPLDGGWTLTIEGFGLYGLQLVDRADRLEGAWRDLGRVGAPNASGLIDELARSPAGVRLVFTPVASRVPLTIVLQPAADGSWSGTLAGEGGEDRGQRRAVTLRRLNP